MYVVIPAIPLIAAGNYSFGMNAEVSLFVWEFLAVLLWGWVSVSRPRAMKDFARLPSFIAVSAFMSWMLFSVAWSVVFNDALFESLRYLSGFLLFMAILQINPDDRQSRRLIILLFATSAIAAIYGIYQGVWGFSEMLKFAIANGFSDDDIRLLRETQRPFSTFFHTNTFAGYLAAMIPLGVLAFLYIRKIFLRVLIAIAFVDVLVALIFTSSRGGWLCAGIVSAAMILFLFKRYGYKSAAVFVLTLLLSTAVYFGIQKSSELVSEGETVSSAGSPIERVEALVASDDISKSSRVVYWQTATRMGFDYQPFGAGMGAYEQLNRQYLRVPAYSRNPHNIWIQYFSEIGVIGLLLFIAFLITLLLEGIRIIKSGGDEGETAFVIMLSAAALLLHASFDLDMDGPATGLTLFAIAGLIVSRRLPDLHSPVGSSERILRTVMATGVIVCVVGLHFINMISANYSNLSDLSSENGSKEKAAEFNAESVDMWPYNPVSTYKQSVLYSDLYDKTGNKAFFEKAVAYVHKAIELNPYQAEYFAALAMLLEQNGANEEALSAALKATKLYPIGIRYHTLFAHMTSLYGSKEEAVNILDNALRNAENYIKYKSPDGYDVLEAQFVKASILNDLKEFDKALAEYDRMSDYLANGLVISPFSSSRHVKDSVDGIKTRISSFREKTQVEKIKAENGIEENIALPENGSIPQ